MSSSIKNKAIAGVFWTLLQRIGQQGVNFITSVILARILGPEDFGLVALTGIFFVLSEVFIDGGLGVSLIRHSKLNEEDKSTVFIFNLAVAFFCIVLLYFLAPLFARFYSEPRLTNVIRIGALSFVPLALRVVHCSLLTREMRFKELGVFNFISNSSACVIGIIMAFSGCGVWSLVAQRFVSNIVLCILVWKALPWKPRLLFSRKSFDEHFFFGSRMLASNLADNFFINAFGLVVGKIHTPAVLALYNRANRLRSLTAQLFTEATGQVLFPVLSKVSGDRKKLCQGMTHALQVNLFAVLPAMAGLFICADPVINILYGEAWMASASYLKLVTFIGMFYPFSRINTELLKAVGRSDLYFNILILRRIVFVIAIFLTYKETLECMILAQVGVSFLGLFTNAWFSGKYADFGIFKQIRSNLSTIVITLIMAIIISGVGYVLTTPEWVVFGIQVLLGILVYVSLHFLAGTRVSLFVFESVVSLCKRRRSR